MKRYVIRRLLMAIPLLLAISFVCFVFINMIPSNPAEVVLRIQQTPIITEEAIAEMEEALGLNKPFLVRYFDWVLGCLQGDFGISYVNPARTVAGELARCLPATLQLAAASFVIVLVLSIPIGFLCAVYKDGWFDKIMRGLVFISTAMPAYWVGLLLMWGISVKMGLLPTNGNGTWQHMILPAFTVALSYISTYIRLIRNNMLENMKQDYVLYANVRGLPQRSILVKHILKNSMHTCIVAMGMSIPQMIAGTIVVENVFSWPGLGTLCISSIFYRDLRVIESFVLFIGVLFVVFNLVFDILPVIDDRVVHVDGVPDQVRQKADRVLVVGGGGVDDNAFAGGIIVPVGGGDRLARRAVHDLPPAGNIVMVVDLHQLAADARHQGDGQRTAFSGVERRHNVALLGFVGVGLCPCVVLTGSVIGGVNLCAGVLQLLRKLGAVAVADGIRAPALQQVEGFRHCVRISGNRHAAHFSYIIHIRILLET